MEAKIENGNVKRPDTITYLDLNLILLN